MPPFYRTTLAGIALAILSVTASAQSFIQLKGGEKLPLEKTLFPMKPVDCSMVDCDKRIKKVAIKDICKAAICLPVEGKDIPMVLGPDALHWRVYPAKGTMTQYLGEQPLGNAVKASAPPIQAKLEDISRLPVVGLKNGKGNSAVQYWVIVK